MVCLRGIAGIIWFNIFNAFPLGDEIYLNIPWTEKQWPLIYVWFRPISYFICFLCSWQLVVNFVLRINLAQYVFFGLWLVCECLFRHIELVQHVIPDFMLFDALVGCRLWRPIWLQTAVGLLWERNHSLWIQPGLWRTVSLYRCPPAENVSPAFWFQPLPQGFPVIPNFGRKCDTDQKWSFKSFSSSLKLHEARRCDSLRQIRLTNYLQVHSGACVWHASAKW